MNQKPRADHFANYRELTIRGIILGAIITVIFTASNVYLGLKVGLQKHLPRFHFVDSTNYNNIPYQTILQTIPSFIVLMNSSPKLILLQGKNLKP